VDETREEFDDELSYRVTTEFDINDDAKWSEISCSFTHHKDDIDQLRQLGWSVKELWVVDDEIRESELRAEI